MRLTVLYRNTLLFVASACLLSMGACTGPGKTGGGGSSNTDYYLEDLGNGVCQEHPSGRMWQIEASGKFTNRKEANEYVSSLELGGYSDWRLPTREECLNFCELQILKKGSCPITFRKAHWVEGKKEAEAGHWEDYPLCGGSEFRWVDGKKGYVRGVRP